jgi:PAS domain S-box-containing protein
MSWRKVFTYKLPWLILIFSLSTSIAVTFITYQQNEHSKSSLIERNTEQLKLLIEYEISKYISLLKTSTLLFDILEKPNRTQWHNFVSSLEIEQQFPGVQALGFAEIVPHTLKKQHIERLHNEGFYDYKIKPEGQRESYAPVIFVEPFDWRNQRAFGYDSYSEPVRREYLLNSMTTGLATATPKITLKQETEEDTQPGFLVFLPVYKSKTPLATIKQREESLIGYVYAAFRMNDLIEGILANAKPLLGFRLYDGLNTQEPNLLYQSSNFNQNSNIYAEKALIVGERTWVLQVTETPKFAALIANNISLSVFIIGTIDTLLLFILALLLITNKETAMTYAQSLLSKLSLENKLFSITDSIPNAIITIDADGVIEMANAECETSLGYSKDELIGMSVDTLIPKPLRSVRSNRISVKANKAIKNGKSEQYELTCQSKLGVNMLTEFTINPVFITNQKFCVCTITNIEVQKKQQQELERQRDELERFVYAASHDLRTPLVSVVGYVRLLTKRTNIVEDERSRHFINRILVNVENMDILLQDLLNFAKTSHKEVEKTAISLNQVLHDIQLSFDKQIEKYHVELLMPDELPTILGHESMILQLFSNLVGNAIKYRAPDRDCKITIGHTASTDKMVTIEIKDNGKGINAQFFKKIFNLFERVDMETPGTGVGLSICKLVVEKHGGSIWLESEEGVGTSFFVTLPLEAK